MCVCVFLQVWALKLSSCQVRQLNLCADAFDPGFKDSGWTCVCVNKEEETSGGSVSAKSDEIGPYHHFCARACPLVQHFCHPAH